MPEYGRNWFCTFIPPKPKEGYTYRTVCGPLGDAYAESGIGPGISYNRSIFRFRIDHILHSADMKAYSATVDTRIRLSDHYPVWCILKLESQN